MANRRMIYQDFFEDDYFGMVEIGMRLLWIGLITAAADDQGRILDNAALIRAKVFMFDNEITTEKIDSWLDRLHNDNKVVRYEAGNKKLIQIIKWWTYQTPAWASASKFPPPEGWIDKVRCHIAGNKQGGSIETMNWDQEGGFIEQSSELHSSQGSAFSSGIDDIKLSRDDVNDNSEIRLEDQPQKDLLKDFTEITGIILPMNGSTYAKWLTEAGDWIRLGVDRDKLQAAYDKAQEKGYTVSRPQSLTSFIRGAIAEKKNTETDKEKLYKEIWDD